MRRGIVIFLIVLTALSVVGLAAYRITVKLSTSGEAPVISFENDVLEVTTDATDEELLQGVSASDAEDGDVTDSLLVEASTHFVSDATVEVTYAAFDSSGHVTKASRNVRYVDYSPPRFQFSGPMIFSEAGVSELLSFVGAHDCIDGDISSRVKVTAVEAGTLLSTPGEHLLEFRVTNSTGDTAYLKFPVEVVSGYGTAKQIPLKEYLVYIPVDSEFDAREYLEDEYADDRDVEVESTVDTAEAGIYDVHYTLGGSSSRLIVVVEGKG